MNIILKFKNFYLKKRKKYCYQKYLDYLSLLKNESILFSFTQDLEFYNRNKAYYSSLCERYKKEYLSLLEKTSNLSTH